jgi:hypothetical protein
MKPYNLVTRYSAAFSTSVKKLRKGHACWATRHIILGWPIELPPHRVARLHAILDSISLTQKRVQVGKWHQLLGDVACWLASSVPMACSMSSRKPLRSTTVSACPVRSAVHTSLDDFRWLAQALTSHPTWHIEILLQDPSSIGAVDASGVGTGLVWFVECTSYVRQLHSIGFRRSISADDRRLEQGTATSPLLLKFSVEAPNR